MSLDRNYAISMIQDLIATMYSNMTMIEDLVKAYNINLEEVDNIALKFPTYQVSKNFIEENDDLLGRDMNPVAKDEPRFALGEVALFIESFERGLKSR